MKFSTDMLDKIEYVSLALENCEEYKIASEDVLEFWTSEIKMGVGYYGENQVDNGGLVISKRAFRNLSSAATDVFADGTTALDYQSEETFYLYNRIINCCDICQVDVKFKDGSNLSFFVPYDPLESNLHGCEIDLSNCPSAEMDENGDMLILFGKSSHAYKRKDDDYFNLIIGLHDVINKRIGAPLQIKLENFSNLDCDNRCPRLLVDSVLKNNGCAGKKLELVFEDVQKVSYDIDFDDEKRYLWMSRISTGEIFVEIENFCTFCCYAIKTYEVYEGKIDNDGGDCENDDIYQKALHCELSEKEMESFAVGHFAHSEKDFDLAAFISAKNKVLNGKISVKYFQFWLEAYSEMVQYYRDIHLQTDGFYCQISIMMDRLQIKLSYCENLSDCSQLIETATEEIEKYYLANAQKR